MRATPMDYAAAHLLKRWEGLRSEKANRAYLASFVNFLEARLCVDPKEITQQDVDTYASMFGHNSASSHNTRMSIVAAFLKEACKRPDLSVKFLPRPSVKKWSMTDEQFEAAMEWLMGTPSTPFPSALAGKWAHFMVDFLVWTVETGLRVEETLRLLPSDFDGLDTDRPALNVPGTKTAGSAMRVPLSEMARQVIRARLRDLEGKATSRTVPERRLFDVSYRKLYDMWNAVRQHLKLDAETATLKGLRRTFAARCLRKGIPVAMIQELMRHSSIDTTMEYLKLFGLSDNDETRALLNKQMGKSAMHARNYGASEEKIIGLPLPKDTKAASDDLMDSLALLFEALGIKVIR